jgi:energy-coupling factor transporter ATP-binding protein EcfA2
MPSERVPFDRLRLRNVRCFRDAEIALHPKVTVIVGGNASGKTTLMEALASLTHGEDEGLTHFPLRAGAGHGEITLYERDKRNAAAKWDSRRDTRMRLPGTRYTFLYGRYRGVSVPEDRALTDAEYLDELASHAAKSRTTTLTRPDNRLINDLAGYLRGLSFGRASDPRLDEMWIRLNRALGQIDSSLSEIRMDEGPDHRVPRVMRNGLALELAQLSDGYQAMLAIVLDLMLRYAYIFFEGDPLAGDALVGIDEIDLHLHPKWQRTVLTQLTELFPGTQFIVTTHSPIVVQSAIDQRFAVVRLVEKGGAVTAEALSPRLSNALRGAEVGSVLYEEHLFGVESRFSVEYSKVEREVNELQAKVSSGEATDAEYRDFKKGLDKLEELVAKEDRRRAEGSTMAQMVRMQAEFVKALADELEKLRS